MPAEKTARVQQRRRIANRRVRSSTRTAVKKAVLLLRGGATADATVAVGHAVSALDRAKSKGVVHRNNASRRKSRLMKALNRATAPE